MVLECLDDVGDGGSLLSDSDVNAEELFVDIPCIEVSFLIDDSINGNGGLSGLSVTNDQLSLSSSDGDETINSLETGLHRFID